HHDRLIVMCVSQRTRRHHSPFRCALAFLVARLSQAKAPARLRFGINTPNQSVAWDDLLAAWKEAEPLGFDTAWVFDHFIPIFGNQDGPCPPFDRELLRRFAQDIMPAFK